MTVVIGTAGHIDHGKTTLLRALTGTDADRLPEEQRRGLTIDVGYAHFAPDAGEEVDFVDVPGHDRLVGNMLVGAGEIDACLLVVAADDGPRAQTWEHLGLLDAMGISRGLVAITKVDLVDAARVETVIAQMRERSAETLLASATIVPISATSGQGLDALLPAIAELRNEVEAEPAHPSHAGVRLAIDRVFSVRGRGVVVTGSSRGAVVEGGALLLARPGDDKVRVRGIEVHDAAVERGPSGGRVALNVAGAGADALRRGQVLSSDDVAGDPIALTSSERVMVSLRSPAALPGRRSDDPWPPADGLEVRLHVGTDQADVIVGRAGRDAVPLPDGRAAAMLRLDRPVALAVGDRFVLRRPAPAGLLAGGVVLDAAPLRGRARRRQTADRVIALAAAVEASDRAAIIAALLELHGLLHLPDGLSMADDVETAAATAALDMVGEHHARHAEAAGLSLSVIRSAAADAVRKLGSPSQADTTAAAAIVVDSLVADGKLVREGDHVRHASHLPAPDPERERSMQRLVELLDVAAPPSLRAAAEEAGATPDAVSELVRSERIIVVDDDLAWSAAAHDSLRSQALALARTAPLTPAALRDTTGTSRKYVMALLEDFDRRGILRRTSAGHVPGPRAMLAER